MVFNNLCSLILPIISFVMVWDFVLNNYGQFERYFTLYNNSQLFILQFTIDHLPVKGFKKTNTDLFHYNDPGSLIKTHVVTLTNCIKQLIQKREIFEVKMDDFMNILNNCSRCIFALCSFRRYNPYFI